MNKFAITRRQALLLFLICTISSKLQMLPCLISQDVGKAMWAVLLMGCAIDVVLFSLVITINMLAPNVTVHDMLRQTFGKVFTSIIGVLLLIYYISVAVLPYQAVREVFASNLFDTLPWQIFSIFLLVAVGYLAYTGMRTIGRTAELYFWIIIFSVVGLITLGVVTTNFIHVLPISDINLGEVSKSAYNNSIWFADYMIFFVLIGRIKTDPKHKAPLNFTFLLYFLGATAVYCLAYITFYGLYTVLTPTQTSLLSGISAFSLTTLEVSRVDWFLVLLSQAASIISCATYTYCATDCINQITGKKSYGICLLFGLIILYLTDIILFNNTDLGIKYLKVFTAPFATIMQVIMPIITLFAAVMLKRKNKQLKEKTA